MCIVREIRRIPLGSDKISLMPGQRLESDKAREQLWMYICNKRGGLLSYGAGRVLSSLLCVSLEVWASWWPTCGRPAGIVLGRWRDLCPWQRQLWPEKTTSFQGWQSPLRLDDNCFKVPSNRSGSLFFCWPQVSTMFHSKQNKKLSLK